MTQILKKAGLMIMALTAMLTLTACPQINHDIADQVCRVLEEKYAEPFVPVKIGGRLNTDSAKLYLHPADNEALLFTASLNRDTEKVQDDYLTEKITFSLEQALKDAFSQVGIRADSRCLAVSRDPLEPEIKAYTFRSFLEDNGLDHYTVYLLADETGLSAEKICAALEALSLSTGVRLVCGGYVFSAEAFDACAEKLAESPEMNTTQIEAFRPLASFRIHAENGTCSLSPEALAEQIGRD